MSTTANQTERVQISKAYVQQQMELGYTKEQIRATAYPSINKNQWNRALKAMSLSSVRAKKVEYVITDELVQPSVEATATTEVLTNEAANAELASA